MGYGIGRNPEMETQTRSISIIFSELSPLLDGLTAWAVITSKAASVGTRHPQEESTLHWWWRTQTQKSIYLLFGIIFLNQHVKPRKRNILTLQEQRFVLEDVEYSGRRFPSMRHFLVLKLVVSTRLDSKGFVILKAPRSVWFTNSLSTTSMVVFWFCNRDKIFPT